MKSNEVIFKVSGRYALFSSPLSKGGEKLTEMVPSYGALKGIAESVYFKPSITILIDKVRVMKPIRMESKGIRPISYTGGNDLSYYTYLTDVEYQVKAHFIFNENRPDLKADWNENKHYFIFKRSINRGGRRDIYLGTRECQAYVVPISEFHEGEGYYDNSGEMDFGLQYHSISYPDENGRGEMTAKFWYPKMVNGVIEFCHPEDCPKERVIYKGVKMKRFDKNNFSGLNEPEILNGYGEWSEVRNT